MPSKVNAENTKQKRGKPKDRGNGDGALWELPTGRWCWQITLGIVNGKQRRMSGTAANKTDAKRAMDQAKTDRDRGVLVSPERITVLEYCETWLARHKHKATATQRGYRRDLMYALEFLGKMKLKDVRPGHIRDALHALADREMKAGLGKGRLMASATLAQVRTRLRAVFREAAADGLIAVNPAENVKRVKPARTEHPGVALDFDQAARLHELGEALHAAGQARLWPAIFAAVSIGLRRGEVMGLRWLDVDLERGVIHVRQNLTTPDGKLEMRRPKTDESAREVLMPSSLKAVLERHRTAIRTELEAARAPFREDSPVFPTALGTYTHPDNLDRALSSILLWSDPKAKPKPRKVKPGVKTRKRKRPLDGLTLLERRMIGVPVDHRATLEAVIHSGKPLPHISPHDLRHTAGTLMLRRGVPVEVVSKTLGHADISLTYRVYRHVLESERRQHVVDLFPDPLPVRPVKPHAVN